jgi:predicted component of type VI protein secretion system
LEGPGLANVDSSFAKQFPIKENWRAEVRAEFFNLFNRANFSLPNATVNSPNYGIINAAAAARSGQLAFRIDF